MEGFQEWVVGTFKGFMNIILSPLTVLAQVSCSYIAVWPNKLQNSHKEREKKLVAKTPWLKLI